MSAYATSDTQGLETHSHIEKVHRHPATDGYFAPYSTFGTNHTLAFPSHTNTHTDNPYPHNLIHDSPVQPGTSNETHLPRTHIDPAHTHTHGYCTHINPELLC